MADAESSRILQLQTCVLTEATQNLSKYSIPTPLCGSCPLPISLPPIPPYQDCSSSIPVGFNPSSIAISPDSLTAWVVNEGDGGGGGSVSRINQLTNEVINSFPLPFPNEIAIDSSNIYVWITTNNDGVIRIDISNNIILPSILIGYYNLEGIAISPNNSIVWVANYDYNNVLYFNTATFTPISTILVGQNPTKIVISIDGLFVYVLNSGDQSISVIYNFSVIKTFTVINYPTDIAISPDNSKLWITNNGNNTISILNSTTITGVLLHTITITKPYGIAITPDYSSVWVTQNDSYTVARINAITYEILSTISVGNYPTGIAINPDNSAVLIVNTYSNTVTKIYTPPSPSFIVEGVPVPNGGSAILLLMIIRGRSVDLTTYVQASDGSALTFLLPINIGGSVGLYGSTLTAFQTTPGLPITVISPSSCTQTPGSMILNIILTVPAFVTPIESDYLLNKVSACPLYILNQIPPTSCQFTAAPDQGTFSLPPDPTPGAPYPYVTTPPGALHQYRSIPRIRGIDQITTLVRGQSASEATTRRQEAVLRGNVASTNPFFRKPLPPPPCVVPFTPKPPYAAAPPCRPVKF
jgi:DNA-binding beta-propeller fold protein YncE